MGYYADLEIDRLMGRPYGQEFHSKSKSKHLDIYRNEDKRRKSVRFVIRENFEKPLEGMEWQPFWRSIEYKQIRYKLYIGDENEDHSEMIIELYVKYIKKLEG
tara:strand:- start:38 stop:346 length:309 start_codon:yes stop_codon:yes gene_type:complete